MISLTSAAACRAPMDTWRRQIGHRHRLAAERGPRPFAVISYRVRGRPVDDRYVPLRHLTLVALYDERTPDGELATRLVGVGGLIDGVALRFGGPALSRFDKNLRMPPQAGGRGPRLDAADDEFLSFALSLERYLERCARHPYVPRRRLPRLPSVTTDGLIDLSHLPKRQVILLDSPAHDLCGCVGSTTFDFYHTRFRVAQ